MTMHSKLFTLGACSLMAMSLAGPAHAGEATKMSFFVTSAGPGDGANLGGLAGADKHCQKLAEAVGAGKRTWRAYLSTTATAGSKAVDARDRIGRGPWHNAKGELIAKNVEALHRENALTKKTALDEKGEVVNGRGDKPNRHDILTGSDSYGRGFPGTLDTTCGNWTKNGAGSAMVGHHDRIGLSDKPHMVSWVQSHPSAGCSQEDLRKTGGDGLFYCFAAK